VASLALDEGITMSATSVNPPIVEESRLARTVFAETGPASIVWLLVRRYLGYEWLVAGWGKVTDGAWMRGAGADLLTGSLRIVYPWLSLRRGAEAMTEDGIGLLVVDARHRPIGVVSARDVMRAFVGENHPTGAGVIS
jgi:hypothetical protein